MHHSLPHHHVLKTPPSPHWLGRQALPLLNPLGECLTVPQACPGSPGLSFCSRLLSTPQHPKKWFPSGEVHPQETTRVSQSLPGHFWMLFPDEFHVHKSGRMDTPVLLLVFLNSVWSQLGFALNAFTTLNYENTGPDFIRALIMKWHWSFWNVFYIPEVAMGCAPFTLLCIYRFAWREPSLHRWDETNLIVVNDPFDVLLTLIC